MKSLFSYNSPLWSFMEKLLHYLWLSLLWAICCLPIITIGASTTALYSVALKYVQKQEGYLTKSFFQALKDNFKQSSIIWCILFFAGGFLGLGLVIYFRMEEMNAIAFFFMIVFISLFVSFVFASIYVYPILATYNNSIGRTIQNAYIMALANPASSIAMCTFAMMILIAGMNFFPPILFISPAWIACIHSRFLHKIFEKYSPLTDISIQEGV